MEKILISREKSKSKMSSASFDIRCLHSVDTSYDFVEKLMHNLSNQIDNASTPSEGLSSSRFYFHRYLRPDLSQIAHRAECLRQQSLSSFVAGMALRGELETQPESEPSVLDCSGESLCSHNDIDDRPMTPQFQADEQQDDVSAIYLLDRGHIVLHFHPNQRQISLDVLSPNEIDFVAVSSILSEAFDLTIDSRVSVFESPRIF